MTLGAGDPSETTLTTPLVDYYVARFSADHTLIFARQMGADFFVGAGARALPSTRTVVASSTPVGPDLSLRIQILDEAGKPVLSRTEEGAFYFGAVAGCADGGFLVTGTIFGRVRLDPGGPDELVVDARTPDTDQVLVRYDAQARPLWARVARGDVNDTPRLVTFDDGSFAFFATSDDLTLGVGEPGETSFAADTGALARFGADGSLLWARRITTSEGFWMSEMGAMDDGSLVIGGTFETDLTLSAGAADEREILSGGFPDDDDDAMLARYREDGSIAWARREGGSSNEQLLGLAAYPDGTTVALIAYRPESTSTSTVFGAGDPGEFSTPPGVEHGLLLARYAADGALVEARSDAEDIEESLPADVAPLPGGSILLATLIDDRATFGRGDPLETIYLRPASWTGGSRGPVVARYSR